MHGSLRKLLMLPAALLLWAACSDDDYHYPSVSLEYLTARSNSTGTLETVLTDGGGRAPEGVSRLYGENALVKSSGALQSGMAFYNVCSHSAV